MLNAALIERFSPHARDDITAGLVAGWPAIYAAGINTPVRLQHFMAEIAVESAGLTRLEENLSYSAERLCVVWPNRFHGVAEAAPYARNPEALANKVYGGRKDLGNLQAGDGWRFRGGGLIQTTGRTNYRAAGFEANPNGLRTMPGALNAALAYWTARNVNKFADKGDLEGERRAINGGLNGLPDLKTYFVRAQSVFTNIEPPAKPAPAPAQVAAAKPGMIAKFLGAFSSRS